MDLIYKKKYLKYKKKYLNLKKLYEFKNKLNMRDTNYRIGINKFKPIKKWYKYPFSVINNDNNDYKLENIFTSIPGQKQKLKDLGDFPNNIEEFIWGQKGKNDEEDWFLLCKLDNNNYVYFHAWCDYTGFECQGGMKVYVSKKLNNLINYAMSNQEYDLYIKTSKLNK
jgi:hypothetical protein